MLFKSFLFLYKNRVLALALLLAGQSWSQSIGENPIMDMRIVKVGCNRINAQGVLALDVQVCSVDGSNRMIQQLQNSVLLTPAFLALVDDVQFQWLGFTGQNYHLQQNFSSNGLIEFIANHYDGMDYVRLAGPTAASWTTVLRLTILFQLTPDEYPVMHWYSYTPYYNVRAINPLDYRIETIHYRELDVAGVTSCSETTLAVELLSFSAISISAGIQLQWTTTCEVNHLGFWVQRSAAEEGDWQTINHLLIPAKSHPGEPGFYVYVDVDVKAGISYSYRLIDVDSNGRQTVHASIIGRKQAPQSFSMGPNYPNPFNASTVIPIQIPKEGWLDLAVYDLLGRPVQILIDQWVFPGTLRMTWNGKDAQGKPQPSGAYFVRMRFNQSVRIIAIQLSR